MSFFCLRHRRIRGRQYVFRYVVRRRPSGRPLFVVFRVIFGGGIWMKFKLATNILHVSGHCWKSFQDQRSKVKIMSTISRHWQRQTFWRSGDGRDSLVKVKTVKLSIRYRIMCHLMLYLSINSPIKYSTIIQHINVNYYCHTLFITDSRMLV